MSVVPPLAAIPVAAQMPWEQSTDVTFLLAKTVFCYVAVPLAFSTLYPSPDGPSFKPRYPDLGTNVHWWAAYPQILTTLILFVGMVRAHRYHRRRLSQQDPGTAVPTFPPDPA